MNVTEMKESDLDIVVELEKQCFKQPWNKEQCLYELQENPFSTGYLLKDEDHIVGYAFLWITFEIAGFDSCQCIEELLPGWRKCRSDVYGFIERSFYDRIRN